MFKKLMTLFRGKTSEVEKNIVKTEAYWDGKLSEYKKTLKVCVDRHDDVLAQIKAKTETLAQMKADMDKYKKAGNLAKQKFDETQNKKFDVLLKEAFSGYNQLKPQVEEVESEISQLNELEEKLRIVRNNTQNRVSKLKITITQNKSRIQFSKTMKDLTDGIEEFTTDMKIEGTEEVAEDFFKQEKKLESLSNSIDLDNLVKDTDMDKAMEEFLKQ